MSKLIPNTTQFPNVLLDEVAPILSSASLRVLIVIVRKTYGFHRRADRISFNQLQKLAGLSRVGVNKGLKGLAPLLKIRPGLKNSPTLEGVTSYEINLDIPTAELVSKLYQYRKLTSKKSMLELVSKAYSSKETTKENKSAESDEPIPSSVFPEKEEEKTPPPSRRNKTRPRPPAVEPEAFTRFYQVYPRRVDRAGALKAWLKLSPGSELIAEIMAGLQRYAVTVSDTDPKYIKHPGPWLNARRWEDEPVNGNNEPPPFKDLGNGIVEADGLTMTLRDYERKYARSA